MVAGLIPSPGKIEMIELKTKLSICMLLIIIGFTAAKAQPKNEIADYPLHVQHKRSDKPVLVYFTGDGGWNTFSESVINELGKNGYPTIVLDTRKYFWNQKTPAQFAADMKVILNFYLKSWNKDSYAVIGYSFGADVAAFLPAYLPDELSDKMNSMVLLSPGFSTGFVVKLKNMLNFGGTDKEKYKVHPELLKSPVPVWCIFGKDEGSDFAAAIKESAQLHKVIIPGSHRYNDDVSQLSKTIIRGLNK